MKRSMGAARPASPLRVIIVRRRPGGTGADARLQAGGLVVPCVIGPAGVSRRKREGDQATPAGCYALVSGFYRSDRLSRPRVALRMRATRPDDGWCDDPASPQYNKPVRLPFGARHETMTRQDQLYDLGLVIDYNHSHPRKGRGSAIFMHVMARDATPTAGCIALRPRDLCRLLPRLSKRCRIAIG